MEATVIQMKPTKYILISGNSWICSLEEVTHGCETTPIGAAAGKSNIADIPWVGASPL